MELRTLKYLISLAERGSFTAAAREHFVTQPAVSIQLRKLQEELSSTLLETAGRRIRFTPAGEIMLEYARRFFSLEHELRRELADLEGLKKGSISLGTIDAASIYVLPDVYTTFRKRYPGIGIHLEIAPTTPLVRKLREGELDAVIGTLPLEDAADLEVFPVYDEPMVVIAPPAHPLAGRRRVRPEELARHPFIMFHRESITRRMVERVLAESGVTPTVSMAIDSPEAIRNLVSAGMGLAVLPERVVHDAIAGGAAVILPVAGLEFKRTLGLILPERRYLPATVRAFLDVIAEVLHVDLPRRLAIENDRPAGGAGTSGVDGPSAAGVPARRSERSGGVHPPRGRGKGRKR